MLKEAVQLVKGVFSPRDVILEQLEALQAVQAKAAAERGQALARAKADVDRLEEPKRRLARLQAEDSALSAREERQRALIERQLQEHPTRELQRFEALLARLVARARALSAPSPVEEIHSVTGAVRVANIPDIERWLAVGPALARVQIELRDRLWRLPSDALDARLAELRAELEETLRGTALEHEIG